MNQPIWVKSNEFSGWLADNPSLVSPILQGYKAAIPQFGNDLLVDRRSGSNDHWFNEDFRSKPRWFMGYQELREQGLFIISCLYVFPDQRHQGFATGVIESVKSIVKDIGVIQIAVEHAKLLKLHDFYTKLGFKTTGDLIPDALGISYRDYFWSGREIKLTRSGGQILIAPLNVTE